MSYLRDLIDAKHSANQMRKIVKYIGNDQNRFDEQIKITLGNEERLSQRASWPVGYCVEAHPELAKSHLKKIIKFLPVKAHPAIQRNLAKLLTFVEIPTTLESLLIENCFLILNSNDSPIANRAYAAYAIEKVCRKYPELYQELISCLQAHSEVASPGMKAVMRKIIKCRDKILAKQKNL